MNPFPLVALLYQKNKCSGPLVQVLLQNSTVIGRGLPPQRALFWLFGPNVRLSTENMVNNLLATAFPNILR